MGKKFWHWLIKNEGLVLILLLVIILRLPSWYEPLWYGDEGIYLTLGQALRKGLVWYRDIHDNKPPLLYLLAAVAGNVFYFRLILTVWFSAAVIVFYRLLQLMFPKKKAAWYVAVLALIGLTTAAEGNVANAEIFMLLPTVTAILLIYQGQNFFISGLLFSLAFLFKVPAGLDLAAAGLWLMFWQKTKPKQLIQLGLGFALPVLATIVYYDVLGAFTPYVRAALMQNIGYLGSWGNSQSGLTGRAVVLIVCLATTWWLGKKYRLKPGFNLALVWFLMALFAALLSGRPYPHYLIQPAVPAVLLISWFVWGRKKMIRWLVLGAALISAFAYTQIGFWSYPIVSYYQNFVKYLSGQETVEAYREFFDPRVNQNYQVAAYLKEKTLASDRIFVWGDEPGIYALARRLPVGRYTVAYHIIDFNGFKETAVAWDRRPPKVVVVLEYERQKFPEMEARLSSDYVLAAKIQQADIYRQLEVK